MSKIESAPGQDPSQEAHRATIDALVWHAKAEDSAPELAAKNRELQHLLLIAEDRIQGLEAEDRVIREKLKALEQTDIGVAIARVDKLEDVREGLIHELNLAIQTAQKELARVKSSRTWRLGSMVMRPLAKVTGRAGE